MPKIKKENIHKTEPYRSILNLLNYCGSYINKNGEKKECWLSFGQIFYAVKKTDEKNNPAIVENGEHQNFFSKMVFSHDYSFRDLYEKKKQGNVTEEPKIIRSVDRKQRLTEQLNLLHNKGFVEFKGSVKKRRYGLTRCWSMHRDIQNIKKTLNRRNTQNTNKKLFLDIVLEAINNDFSRSSHDTRDNFLVWGLPLDFIVSLPEKDREIISSSLNQIEENINRIKNVKKKHYHADMEEYFNMEVEERYVNDEIGFCYSSYVIPNMKKDE